MSAQPIVQTEEETAWLVQEFGEDVLLGDPVELQKIITQIQLRWKYNLDRNEFVLMWKANDGEHNYGCAVGINDPLVCRIVRGLMLQAQCTIQKLGKKLRPGYVDP